MAEPATQARQLFPALGAPVLPLALLAAITAVDGMDGAIFGVLVPEIRDWFGVSLTTAVTLQTVAALLTILLAVPIGFLADRVKRTTLVVIAGVLWGVMTLLTGVAPTILVLLISRFGSGITATVAPAHNALIADYYPPESRTFAFSAFSAAGHLGKFVGPIFAGYLAAAFTWQAPFIVIALPSVVLAVVIALRLREPERGGHERAALGIAADDVTTRAPSMTESWRIAKSVRTLRRIWWALPFLAGGSLAIVNFTSVFFDETFHLGAIARGNITAGIQPFSMAGLVVGGVVGQRLLKLRPARLVAYVGMMGAAQAVSLVFVAIAPTWWTAIIPFYIGAFAGAITAPAMLSLLTLVIPPRIRGSALGFAAWFIAPGLLISPYMASIADRVGMRWGIAASIPLFLIGSAIIATAGASMEADIRQAAAAVAAASASVVTGEDESGNLLVVRDLDVHFGGVQILFGVDLEVVDGEILALLGTNGAGKSTLLRAIAGTVIPSNGAIFLRGEDITYLPPAIHAQRGIAQVQGGRGVLPNLTVAENIALAEWGMRATPEAVTEALALFPVLAERSDQPAANLSGGEQQMLALAQAFMARPSLLIIDELSLGLAPVVVAQLLDVVRAMHAQGTTIILVEQSVNVALEVADRAVFMEKGEVRFTGPARDLLDRPDILRAVLLSDGATAVSGSYGNRGTRRDAAPTTVLDVRGLVKSFGGIAATRDVSFTVEQGQILGLIGPNGAGKTTLFDQISGFVVPDAGQIILDGTDITMLPPDQRARLGLHRSFQDAGLFPSLTVVEAITVALERHLEVKSPILGAFHLPQVRRAERKVRARADRLIDLLGLGAHRDKFLRELSTGTRRLVDLASVVAAEPKVLLLDEPSAGVAQKETEELGPILERIRYEVGCAIVIIEHDMPLISALSDELLALEQGAVVTRGAPVDVLNHPQVVAAYLGVDEAAIARSGSVVRT